MAGLLERLKSLKGAPLERGCSTLSGWTTNPATRAEMEPTVRAFLADPPAAKQCRDIGTALDTASGDDWRGDLLLETGWGYRFRVDGFGQQPESLGWAAPYWNDALGAR